MATKQYESKPQRMATRAAYIRMRKIERVFFIYIQMKSMYKFSMDQSLSMKKKLSEIKNEILVRKTINTFVKNFKK